MNKFWIIFVSLVFSSSFSVADNKISYIDLINRLTDLEHLAVLPESGEKCAQWSSFDRDSYYNKISNSYVNWSANSDGKYIVRTENGKEVLAEMKGPGVIWHIWSANAGKGHVRIYLDGSDRPEIDLPFIGYFNGKNEPFNRSRITYRGRGYNSYIPIPFKKSCKIIADPNWGEYYHFTYTTYPEGTKLPRFKQKLSKKESAALDRVNKILAKCGIDPAGGRPGEDTLTKKITIPSGESVIIAELNGPRAITALKFKMDIGKVVTIARLGRGAKIIEPFLLRRELPDTPEYRNVLRELVLQISWDGESQPSVWSPLGDFFGTAPGWNQYRSLPMGMTKNAFYSYWYMPFGESALITLSNEGNKKRIISYTITHVPLSKPLEKLGRFHAKWHRDAFLPDEEGRSSIDWTLLKTEGRGRYCGVMLHVSNPEGGWWGEGDEKFFVDSEKFPSWFGTGSEDYFGFAWGSNTIISRAYHSQTITPRTVHLLGHTCMNRWHITDNIPFQESFEGAIGKYFPNSRPTLYDATVYWYQATGQKDQYSPVPIKERVGYWPEQSNFGIEGCFEGEDLKILNNSSGTAEPQYVAGRVTGAWSGRRGKIHLWWSEGNPGDVLDLSVPVEKKGKYRIRTQLIKGEAYGIFQLFLDNNKLGSPLDLYDTGLIPTGPIDMGIHELTPGEHLLRVEIVGSNEKAVKEYQFGMDYLQMDIMDPLEVPAFEKDFIRTGEFKKIYDPSIGENKTRGINDHCFIRDRDGFWHFFGITSGPVFAHATADSLVQKPWIKQPFPMYVDWDQWKEVHLWAPHIVYHEGNYYMYYCPGSKEGSKYKIHLATSSDLWTWKRHAKNPLFFDGFDARDPMVLRVRDKWVMYYTANLDPRGGNHVVAYRTSDDLVNWSDRNVAFIDPGKQKAGGPTESPFVVRRGDYYYIFIGPRQGYVGTDVFRSKDPFKWRLEDRVGHIKSHAAEVVRDEKGQWFVSHAGGGQGGLWLAPLYWNDGLDDADSSLPVPVME